MTTRTLLQLRGDVQDDMDLADNNALVPNALLDKYINNAIDTVEQILIPLDQDYLLSSEDINLVADQADYSLPTTIFGNKIRGIVYNNGNDIYEILPMRRQGVFYNANISEQFEDSTRKYRYLIRNSDAATGFKLRLYPTPPANETGTVEVWFLRNFARLSSDSDVCDAPEAYNLIRAICRRSALAKIHAGIIPPTAQADVDRETLLYREAMGVKIVDEHSGQVDADLSHYQEHE